ncbi:MAG: glycosyltransferase family 4 protein [Planctomycetota bacterium]
MNITFLSPPPNLFGGERVLAIYARELIELGHDVEIVCYQKRRPPFRERFKKRIIDSASLPRRFWDGAETRKQPASHYEAYGVPYRTVDHDFPISDDDLQDADIVMASFWKTAIWAANLDPAKGKRFYCVQHDEGAIHGEAADDSYRLPLRQIYVSDWIANRIRQRHPDVRGEVILNAVDRDEFDCGKRSKPDAPVFGMMWSPDFEKKGTDVAIKAIKQAKQIRDDICLIGYGATMPESLEWFDQFCHQPSRSELANLYRQCTAWLFPSRFEGYGLPIIESLAARTPVIGTPSGAGANLIEKGGGRLVEIGDANAMSDAMIEFATINETEWAARSERAGELVATMTWQSSAKRLEAAFLSAVEERSCVPPGAPAKACTREGLAGDDDASQDRAAIEPASRSVIDQGSPA